jgi:Phage integrase family
VVWNWHAVAVVRSEPVRDQENHPAWPDGRPVAWSLKSGSYSSISGCLFVMMKLFSTGPGGVIVTNRCGRVAQRNSFGTCWREAVAAAGLPAGTRFHDLRHFYASALIAANLNPKVIQARLGHATIAETMDTYGHLFPDSGDLGRGAIDAILAPADVRLMCATEGS